MPILAGFFRTSKNLKWLIGSLYIGCIPWKGGFSLVLVWSAASCKLLTFWYLQWEYTFPKEWGVISVPNSNSSHRLSGQITDWSSKKHNSLLEVSMVSVKSTIDCWRPAWSPNTAVTIWRNMQHLSNTGLSYWHPVPLSSKYTAQRKVKLNLQNVDIISVHTLTFCPSELNDLS